MKITMAHGSGGESTSQLRVEFYSKEKQYCRLWQEVKKDEDWSRTKKSLPLSELGKYSKNPLRQSFSELGAKLGTLEELVSETNQNRKQYALLFPAQEVKIPLCAYLLTRISPLI